jgi:hypothetical protein
MGNSKLKVVAGQSVKAGLTSKQEAFAQAVAKGLTLADAYRQSYCADKMKDGSIWSEASALMSNPKVTSRVGDLQQAKEDKTLHDSVRLRRLVLDRLHQEAIQAESDSARIRALELLGKSIAMFTDRVEQDEGVRTSTDLEQELIDRLKSLSA